MIFKFYKFKWNAYIQKSGLRDELILQIEHKVAAKSQFSKIILWPW